MKKILIYFASLIVGLSLFISCDDLNEPVVLKDSDKFVAFAKTTASVKENTSGQIGILVYIASPGGNGCSVDFYFDYQGINNSAIEGVDFQLVNSNKTLTFTNYYGYDTIWIDPVDNAIYEGNKTVNITLSWPTDGFSLGRESTLLLTIVDDEHPLKDWIGTFTADAASQGSPGAWDETWTIETAAVDGDPTSLTISGIAGSPSKIVATFNTDDGTVTIQPGQTIDGYSYGDYGVIGIYWGQYPDIDVEKKIIGEFFSDGSIYLPNFGEMFVEEPNVGIVWDVFDVTMTPAKGVQLNSAVYPSSKDLKNRKF